MGKRASFSRVVNRRSRQPPLHSRGRCSQNLGGCPYWCPRWKPAFIAPPSTSPRYLDSSDMPQGGALCIQELGDEENSRSSDGRARTSSQRARLRKRFIISSIIAESIRDSPVECLVVGEAPRPVITVPSGAFETESEPDASYRGFKHYESWHFNFHRWASIRGILVGVDPPLAYSLGHFFSTPERRHQGSQLHMCWLFLK